KEGTPGIPVDELRDRHENQRRKVQRIKPRESKDEELARGNARAADSLRVKPEKDKPGKAEKQVHGARAVAVEENEKRVERLAHDAPSGDFSVALRSFAR